MARDKSVRKNLSTFTSYNTLLDNISVLFSLNKNLVDRKSYKRLTYKERKILRFMKRSVELSPAGKAILTSGSSESIMLAVSFHYMNYRRLRDSDSSALPNIVVSELCHNVFQKISAVFNLELRSAKINSDLTVDVDDLTQKIDENTLCIVGIAGTTEAGTIDNLAVIGEIAEEKGIPFHVDAAIGGGVLPYIEDAPQWNFSHIPALTTMNISLSKYGTTVPGLGVLLLRDHSSIPHDYPYKMEYIAGGKTGDLGLLCTRPSFPLVHFYRKMKKKGVEGFRKFITSCNNKAENIRELLKAAGFDIIDSKLPIITFKHSDEEYMQNFLANVKSRGFTISYSTIKPLGKRYARIVVRKNVNTRTIKVLKSCLKAAATNRPSVYEPARKLATMVSDSLIETEASASLAEQPID